MILEVGKSSDSKVLMQQVGHISDASHVQVLRGDLIGFAVRARDDSFPYLANWTTGRMRRLKAPPVPSHPATVFPIVRF